MTVGSIRKFTVEGISFDIAADANISRKPTRYETSMVATSGKSMPKKVRIVPAAEGIVLVINTEEELALKSFSESLTPLKISYENAKGDVFRCEGSLEIEAVESEEGKANCTALPVDDWTAFPA